MPPEDENANDAAARRRIRLPGTGLENLFPDLQLGLKGLGEIGECLRPLTEPLAIVTAPFVQMAGLVAQTTVGLGMKRWAAAESLLARGWVPNLTTPFDLVERCGDDDAKLKEALLAHYDDNWGDVRARLEGFRLVLQRRRCRQGQVPGGAGQPRARGLLVEQRLAVPRDRAGVPQGAVRREGCRDQAWKAGKEAGRGERPDQALPHPGRHPGHGDVQVPDGRCARRPLHRLHRPDCMPSSTRGISMTRG